MSAQDEGAAVAGYWEELVHREANTVVDFRHDLATDKVRLMMADGSTKTVSAAEAKQIIPYQPGTDRFMRMLHG